MMYRLYAVVMFIHTHAHTLTRTILILWRDGGAAEEFPAPVPPPVTHRAPPDCLSPSTNNICIVYSCTCSCRDILWKFYM